MSWCGRRCRWRLYCCLMGNYFQTVVDLDATPADARTLADSGLDWLVREG